MMGWARVASLHAWGQQGHRAVRERQWDDAWDAHVGAGRGPLGGCRGARSQRPRLLQLGGGPVEVHRFSEEVFCGMALLQLRWPQARADPGAADEAEIAQVLHRAVECAGRALQLDGESCSAHTRIAPTASASGARSRSPVRRRRPHRPHRQVNGVQCYGDLVRPPSQGHPVRKYVNDLDYRQEPYQWHVCIDLDNPQTCCTWLK
ncbi:unnamed protein product [Prorocentrum cordatum]|uniref:Uncharacterized protein n=1 Tax=Prorocentrum cordatum TaxID=2364126 RepID=A0ABN9RVQ7_9DINO|nr:unnamed protein product [Polarella glacialis]